MKSKFLIAMAMFCGSVVATQAQNPEQARSEVNQRMENQHDRIKQGERSGELTKKEAIHIKKKEMAIHHQVAKERAAHGGELTLAEKVHVNKELNRESKTIYAKKHNDVVRHKAVVKHKMEEHKMIEHKMEEHKG